jgi:hypothetical protein
VLGIMQELYDEMLPGITQRQAAYAEEIGAALAAVVDVQVAAPARNRADIESVLRGFENDGLDGVLVVMLTYGPGMRVARALSETRLPICLANIQPAPEVTTAWDMGDLTYNQGIHGAQDTANAMVRAGRPFHVVTGDWNGAQFTTEVIAWARAAAAVTRWRTLKIAVFGYAMNGMGDIRVDEHSFLRTLGPQIDSLAPGAIVRAAESAAAAPMPLRAVLRQCSGRPASASTGRYRRPVAPGIAVAPRNQLVRNVTPSPTAAGGTQVWRLPTWTSPANVGTPVTTGRAKSASYTSTAPWIAARSFGKRSTSLLMTRVCSLVHPSSP